MTLEEKALSAYPDETAQGFAKRSFYKRGYKAAIQDIKDEINGLTSALKEKCNPDPFGDISQCLADAEIEAFKMVIDIMDELTKEG